MYYEKQKHLLKKMKNTRNTLYRTMTPQSPLKCETWTSHSSPRVSSTVQNTLQSPVLELPSAAQSYFPESHWWSETSSLSKVILVLGNTRNHRVPNLGFKAAESPGWFDVSPKISAQDAMREQAHCCDEAVNPQLPIAAAIFIVLHLNRWRTLGQYLLLIVWSGGAYSW